MIPAISLFLIVTLSILITRVATVALMHTGLSRQSAQFQARSAYTGSGFTTQESEKVMNHPVRRKIIFNLMLVGNAGFVTVMSSLILTFILPDSLSSKLYGLLVIVIGTALLWWAFHSEVLDKTLSKVINKMLKKYTDLDVQDYAAVLHLKDSYRISEKHIADDDAMCNKTLTQLNLRDQGVSVLGIDRNNEDYFGSPTGSFEFLANDVVTLYGKADDIERICMRKKADGSEN